MIVAWVGCSIVDRNVPTFHKGGHTSLELFIGRFLYYLVSVYAIVLVFQLFRSCLLITMIKFLTGYKSLGSYIKGDFLQIFSLSLSLSLSHCYCQWHCQCILSLPKMLVLLQGTGTTAATKGGHQQCQHKLYGTKLN